MLPKNKQKNQSAAGEKKFRPTFKSNKNVFEQLLHGHIHVADVLDELYETPDDMK